MPVYVRAFIDSNGPVAEVCLLVQGSTGPATRWQWDLPYLLWAHWGTGRTASWLCEQFRRHDYPTFQATGSRLLLLALRRALYQHAQQDTGGWLTP